MIIKVSVVNAITDPTLYAMFLNRSKMYRPIATKENTTAQIAEVLISSAILGPTFWELIILPPVWFSRSMKISREMLSFNNGLTDSNNTFSISESTEDELSWIR